ncbi:hypothetical protein BT93_L2285 [Corymbia citriodora subsp. variegata]|uniref:Disease resistance RPP13-like protein 1 n=1 Tax=Corymbia citriodora subsp. variegata TaxID=360336 RepID=A0A8T0CKA0_CORYI|nr:hypothetical protein BT93_L2285 [Corymbia citriodora subsp. variegata]
MKCNGSFFRERKSALVVKKSLIHTIISSYCPGKKNFCFLSALCTLFRPFRTLSLNPLLLTKQAMPIAELFLGAFLQVLFDRLASRKLLNFAQREGIDTRLKKWEKTLISINQVLDDAEDRQLNGDLRVNSWLEDLRDLAYDIEDLLDVFAIEFAENKSKAEPDTSKARSLLLSCCFRLSSRAFTFDHEMRSKMEEMDGRLKDINTQKDILSLKENDGKRAASRRVDKLPRTTNLPEPCFVSREVEKMEILELLTGEEENDRTSADLKVIPIVGMGGVGKTALAQHVYNDARVTDYFDVKAWACVSDEFDILAITKKILETTNDCLSCEGKDLNWLHDELKKHLAGKKFLVILDDVWNENYGHWIIFLKPFLSGAKGSKIILTTRNFRVAEIAGAQPYTLKGLSQDDCMTLFAFHALRDRNFDHHRDLEVLGMKIVEKCQGLPLAVKTLAGLLRFKVDPNEWQDVLNNKIWDLSEGSNDILPALKLSYLHLPPSLTRCFAYCAIFPNDYEIEQDELIHWWIAEGLLEGKEGNNRWKVGLKFFNELVSRSLLQKSSSSESRFLMHDLVSELAKLVAGATYFCSREFEFESDQNNAFLARHASFIPSEYIVLERFKIYHGMKGLRSFISLQMQSGHYINPYLSEEMLCNLLSRLKYLRVLSLCHYCIKRVPDCIGKLRHLRYLNLSYTRIETLPNSIVALYNLETLMLRGCQNLNKLPEGNLVGLEILPKFVVGAEEGSRLKELKNLNNLRGELCIYDLHKVREAIDAMDANLCMKEAICQLTMQWCQDFGNFRNAELEAEVSDFLRPHPKLENLVISYYGGLEFPPWLGSPSYVKMVRLHLCGCHRAKVLPSLGQLSSLKKLYIKGQNAICTIGFEFYGTKNAFPSLMTLKFEDMPLWEDWSHCVGTGEVGVLFPCLEHLVIRNCSKLIGRLPSQLSSLRKLEIKSCPCLDASSSIISLPSLNKLNFGGCNEGVLKGLLNLTSLTALFIQDVVELTHLNHGFTSSLIKLEKLEMQSCENLLCLWQDRDVISDLACLKSLAVKNCPEFISFTTREGDIELPSNLETVQLENCKNLEQLPSKMHALSSLRKLAIYGCLKLVCFPETGVPASLTTLSIEKCEMLLSLPKGYGAHELSSSKNHGDILPYLQNLNISNCNSLQASPFSEVRFLPRSLKTIHISSCWRVESLAVIAVECVQLLEEIYIINCQNLRSLPQGLHTLSHLTYLLLAKCPALELEYFPSLPPGISKLYLRDCPKIKSLPNQLHRLTYLRELQINSCESITCFPYRGLPPQLQILEVIKCKNMRQPVREWLTPLTSLQFLSIDGSVGGVGEEEDPMLPLPSSLLHLRIFVMKKVKRLSSSLPPSLQTLGISSCPKLRELSQDGLPPSLERLWVTGCDILEERCKKGTGCYWPLIRQIPYVSLSGADRPWESIT